MPSAAFLFTEKPMPYLSDTQRNLPALPGEDHPSHGEIVLSPRATMFSNSF